MLGAKTTHRHSLHAPSPTIVTQCDTRQTVQSICHVGHAQTQHLAMIHDIQRGSRCHRMMLMTINNLDLVKTK